MSKIHTLATADWGKYPSDLYVLLVLADNADGTQRVSMSLADIGRATGYSPKTTFDAIQRLLDRGALNIVEKGVAHHPTKYLIDWSRV